MVWIHGGGYEAGSSRGLNGTAHVEASNGDIVWVTVQYRLAAFGFLGSAALRSLDAAGSTGNYGLQDQRLALEWVQKNIAAFHGDPQRVTIDGCSAGAGSTANHVVNANSWPFFAQAAGESGMFAKWNANAMATAEGIMGKLANFTGCDERGSASAVVCLQAQSATDIIRASGLLPGLFPNAPRVDGIVWAPVIDGVDTVGHPLALAKAGRHFKGPMLLGTARDEGTTFNYWSGGNCPIGTPPCPVLTPPNLTKAQFCDWAPRAMPGVPLAQILGLYAGHPPTRNGEGLVHSEWYWAAAKLTGDVGFHCGSRMGARWLSGTQKVFLYSWSPAVAFGNKGQDMIGHCSENPTIYMVPSGADYVGPNLTRAVGAYWFSFAKHGDPNPSRAPGSPEWPAYSNTSDTNLVFDAPIRTEAGLRKAQCDACANTPLCEGLDEQSMPTKLSVERPLKTTDDEAAIVKVVLTQYALANVSAGSPPLKSGSAGGKAAVVARVEKGLDELQQPIVMPSSTWKCAAAATAGANGTSVTLRCSLLKGDFNKTNVTVSIVSTHRGYDGASSYLAAPSALWDGRRFNYDYSAGYMGAVPAPFWTPQGPPAVGGPGPGAPAVCAGIWGQPPLSDNLNRTRGQPWSPGQMEWVSADVATPAVGWLDRNKGGGWWTLGPQQATLRLAGRSDASVAAMQADVRLVLAEQPHAGTATVQYEAPGVRQVRKYGNCGYENVSHWPLSFGGMGRTMEVWGFPQLPLRQGTADAVELTVELHRHEATSIPAFWRAFHSVRYNIEPRPLLKNIIPFSYVWQTIMAYQDKNRWNPKWQRYGDKGRWFFSPFEGAVQHPVAYALGDSLRNTSFGPHNEAAGVATTSTHENGTCWSEDQTAMWGFDMKLRAAGVTSAEGCCAACRAHPGCKFWTYQYSLPGHPRSHASSCDLKSGSSGYRRFGGCISGGPGPKPGDLPPLPPPPGPAVFSGPVPGLPAPDLNNRRCGDGHNGIKDQSSAMCEGSSADGRLAISLAAIKQRCGVDARCIGFAQDGNGPAPSGYFRPLFFCEPSSAPPYPLVLCACLLRHLCHAAEAGVVSAALCCSSCSLV